MPQPLLEPQTGSSPHRLWVYLAASTLAFLTLAFYWPITWHQPILLDDPVYVFDNPVIKQGLTLESLRWSLATTEQSNWHPLTWVSHAIDYGLYADNPAGHFATNACLHAVNSGLVTLALTALTGAFWRSLLVGVLFAIHPMHVESVAWLSQRKELLAAFFGFIALWGYADYCKTGRTTRYAVAVLGFTLSMMAKQSWVMFPVLLLFLDVWPLSRTAHAPGAEPARDGLTAWQTWWQRRPRWLWLVYEKLPFFIISFLGGWAALSAQSTGGALPGLDDVGIGLRVQNALVSYMEFARKVVWPDPVVVFYPLPESIAVTTWLGALIGLAAITAIVWLLRHSKPCLVVGWAWFVVSILPVIGLVQLSDHAMADRYAYMPYTGLFIGLVWAIPDSWAVWARSSPVRTVGAMAAMALLIVLYGRVTLQTLDTWRDTRSLFTAAVQNTHENHLAYAILATQSLLDGNTAAASASIRLALAYKPDSPRINLAAGRIAMAMGNGPRALEHFEHALKTNPDMVGAHLELARYYESRGIADKAVNHLLDALKTSPDMIAARVRLARVYLSQSDCAQAVEQARKAIDLGPYSSDAAYIYGAVLEQTGDTVGARLQYDRAIVLNPHNLLAQQALTKLAPPTCRKRKPATEKPYSSEPVPWP